MRNLVLWIMLLLLCVTAGACKRRAHGDAGRAIAQNGVPGGDAVGGSGRSGDAVTPAEARTAVLKAQRELVELPGSKEDEGNSTDVSAGAQNGIAALKTAMVQATEAAMLPLPVQADAGGAQRAVAQVFPAPVVAGLSAEQQEKLDPGQPVFEQVEEVGNGYRLHETTIAPVAACSSVVSGGARAN